MTGTCEFCGQAFDYDDIPDWPWPLILTVCYQCRDEAEEPDTASLAEEFMKRLTEDR
jgi:hypothetical protein